MLKIAFGAVLSIVLLASCGSREAESEQNRSVGAGANAVEASTPSDPAQPDMANGTAEPVPPPDAVSHPDGFLPPAPGEADPAAANSSGPETPGPATEDENMRNRQSGG